MNIQQRYGDTAFIIASYKRHKEIVRLLLQNGADMNARNKMDNNALWNASWRGHEEIVWLLLQNGADVNAQTEAEGYGSALQATIAGEHEQIVQLLLREGVVE